MGRSVRLNLKNLIIYLSQSKETDKSGWRDYIQQRKLKINLLEMYKNKMEMYAETDYNSTMCIYN